MPTIIFKNEHAFSYDTSLSMCPDSVFLRSMYKRIEHNVWLHGHIRKNLAMAGFLSSAETCLQTYARG
jgi:hypothetical protein